MAEGKKGAMPKPKTKMDYSGKPKGGKMPKKPKK